MNTLSHNVVGDVAKLNENNVKAPTYYFDGKRKEQMTTPLRIKWSSLNQYLYSKNIIDSRLCRFGATEDANHYSLHCPLFQKQSHEMVDSEIANPTAKILLYGNLALTFEENKSSVLFIPILQERNASKYNYNYCPFDISRKDVFCLALYFEWKYFVLIDHIQTETICLFCYSVLL